jgi:hypothetical protein
MGFPDFRACLRRALPAFALLAAPAHADTLDVVVAPTVALSPTDVQAAIAAELGASIDGGGTDLGAIAVTVDGSQLVVTYQRPDGSTLVRGVTLPAVAADQLELIALVTGNLVRDQVSDLPVIQPPSASQPVFAAAAPAMPVAAIAAEQPLRTVPIAIGLVPPLSTDRLVTSRARVRGALHAVAGASSSVAGVSVSGAVDVSGFVRGVQIGGAASIAGDVDGFQIGGAVTATRALRGLQVGGAVAAADSVRGVQLAGATTVASRVDGMQLAGGAAVTGRIEGAQVASINVARTVHGLQLGAINIARRVHGLQLGAINISEDSDAQIGALNFVRNGRTDIDAWAETNGLGAIALRHGGRLVHNIYAVGWTPDAGDTPLIGMGLGIHRPLGRTTLDLDAIAWQTHLFKDGVGLLAQARATLAFELGPFAAFVAAAYNVSVEDDDSTRPVRTTLARMIDEPMSGVDVALWPSLSAGIRGHLGKPR